MEYPAGWGSPHVYNLAGLPTRLDWSPRGEPVLVALEPQHGLVILSEAARWDRAARRKGGAARPGHPAARPDRRAPRGAGDVLARAPPVRGRAVLPPRRHARARPPATMPATGLYYVPQPGLIVPPISQHRPRTTERQAAVTLLQDELLGDFRFHDAEADVTHAIAAMVTPFVRPFYRGHTPLFAISKPMERAGAGLLTDVLLYPHLGRHLPRTSLSERSEEVKKTLFAFAREGTDALLFDNVNGALDQSPLAVVPHLGRLRDRVLGFSTTATAESSRWSTSPASASPTRPS